MPEISRRKKMWFGPLWLMFLGNYLYVIIICTYCTCKYLFSTCTLLCIVYIHVFSFSGLSAAYVFLKFKEEQILLWEFLKIAKENIFESIVNSVIHIFIYSYFPCQLHDIKKILWNISLIFTFTGVHEDGLLIYISI